MLDFGLAALEEVEGVGGFGVDVLDHGENIQDVLFCEGGLVAAVEVVLFYQDLEGQERRTQRTQRLFKLFQTLSNCAKTTRHRDSFIQSSLTGTHNQCAINISLTFYSAYTALTSDHKHWCSSKQ